jgi:hypothetical protein
MSKLQGNGMAVLLLLGMALPAKGQTVAEIREHYVALLRRTTLLKARYDSESKAHLATFFVDTIRAGTIILYAIPSMRAVARIGADSAWLLLSRIYGRWADSARNARLLVSRLQMTGGEPSRDQALADGLGASIVGISEPVRADQITRGTLAIVSPLIYGRADGVLKRWLPWIYPDTVLRLHADAMYEELATTPWSAARRCYSGDLTACRLSLGVTRVDPATGWYNAMDRRVYVAQVLHGTSEAARDCVDAGDDAACIASLKRAPGGAPEPPLGDQARQFLLALAINAGGPRAFERLMAHPQEPLDARIEAAADIPLDSLITRWRDQILAGHPKTVAADSQAAWAAVAWGIALTIVALRSTRWR